MAKKKHRNLDSLQSCYCSDPDRMVSNLTRFIEDRICLLNSFRNCFSPCRIRSIYIDIHQASEIIVQNLSGSLWP